SALYRQITPTRRPDATEGSRLLDRSRQPRLAHHAAQSTRERPETFTQLSSSSRRRGGPYIFCGDLLEHRLVQFCFRQQLLRLGVLILERLQPLGVRYLEATVLSLPLVEGRTADPVLAANIGRLSPSFLLAQHPDDSLP